jgi:hypothetical protein
MTRSYGRHDYTIYMALSWLQLVDKAATIQRETALLYGTTSNDGQRAGPLF